MSHITNAQALNDCPADDVWPIGKKAAFYSCAVVIGLGLSDFITRQCLAAVLPYLKEEWALTDTQLGLMVSVVNITVGGLALPCAYFIDRWSRKKMLCIMGMLWSTATMACGFAGNYAQLFVARLLTGAGEAGYSPTAQALLSAQFPKRHRGTALALSQVCQGLGGAMGLIIGAYIATHWGWRNAFIVVALPGFVLSIMALFIKDYQNIAVTAPVAAAASSQSHALSFRAVLAKILKTPSLLCVYVGAIMVMMVTGTVMNWLPSYLMRDGGMSLTSASAASSMVVFAALISAMAAGPIFDVVCRRIVNAVPLILASAVLLGSMFAFCGYGWATPGSTLQIILLVAAQFCIGAVGTGGPVIIMNLSHPGARGTAAGVLITCQNLFGFAVGPLLAGFISDQFSLGTALLIIAGVAPLLISLSYWICVFTYKRDLAKAGCENVNF